ncbi:MAG TPA: hypothetical protein DIW81_04990 [Planctomycetaceae bacterium]|nr:hypothetical protein [Rubinisphaera sp.]HCS50938.1 hypothetical protein [Planctomycetaceae bacterium]|tara:strand:+ start:92 stop:490 length:399 start_codon:yes stop_codon:yes gene_type:complete
MEPESQESTDTKITRPSCVDVMSTAKWTRMPGKDVRWHTSEAQSQKLTEFAGELGAIDEFTSTNGVHAIHVLICSDGGVISYELGDGKWLHTLQMKTIFRQRVFEMNLVPIEKLGQYLNDAKNTLQSNDTEI